MANRAKTVDNLDIEKIRTYCNDNNIKLTQISEQMGYDKTYLSGVFRGKGRFTVPAYKMFCMIVGAKEDDFYIDDKPKKSVDNTPHQTVINPGISVEQLNAILLQISTMSDTLAKALNEMTKVQNAQTVAITQLNAEFKRFSEYMGVKDVNTDKAVRNDGYTHPVTPKQSFHK